jgi:hypothetical protein
VPDYKRPDGGEDEVPTQDGAIVINEERCASSALAGVLTEA